MAVPSESGAQIDCQISHSAAVNHVSDAWCFSLVNGQELADRFHMREELMLSISLGPDTRAGTGQDLFLHPGSLFAQPFGQQHPSFGQSSLITRLHPQFPHQNSVPMIMYLLTSPKSDY